MKNRICFLMEFRGDGYIHPVMANVITELERMGFQVDTRITEQEPWPVDEMTIDYDLYVLKSSSPETDQLASLIGRRGGNTLNDIRAVQRIRNKVWVDKSLRDHGLPVPQSYIGSPRQLAPVLEERGPLILKPIGGRHGEGVAVVNDAEQLGRIDSSEAVYAQEFKKGDGFDRKIYVIGGDCWASKKVFEAGRSYLNHAQPMRLTPEIRDIALRTGELLGLEVYGIDMIESDDGLWIVDVNGFPGFKGLPGVESSLSSYIAGRARRA